MTSQSHRMYDNLYLKFLEIKKKNQITSHFDPTHAEPIGRF